MGGWRASQQRGQIGLGSQRSAVLSQEWEVVSIITEQRRAHGLTGCGQWSVCDHRDRGGGCRGRHAAEAPQRVLVVPPHVEPHAATPVPQSLRAG